MSDTCGRCGRRLKDPFFREVGYGRTCLCCGNCHERKQMDVTLPAVPSIGRDAKTIRVGCLCKCGQEKADAEKADRERREFEQRMDRLRRDGITDPAYLQYTFAQDDQRNPKVSDVCRRYVENWEEMKAQNIGILFYGDVGTGKSFLACAIANALLERLVSVSVTNFPRILNSLQGSFDDERQKRIDRLQHYSLLVIDDLGVERDTSYSVEQVYNVVKRLRDDEGKKIVGVLHDYKGDNIGLINVKNGVVLNDGTTVTGDKAVAWVSGASAGAEINESLTNTAYDDAVDVDIKYTKSQFEAAIQAGEFVFYADYGKARVLTDINSLTSFGGGVTEDWTSNRVIRVLDGWANDVARIFGDSYIGKVTNSDTGRQLFKADLVSLALQYQDIDAISDFVSEDITIQQGNGKRDVAVDSALKPNDSMEKLYMTTVVN